MSQGRYTVVYERDESGAWNAYVPEVPGCHTYGRSLRLARERIRETLGLWVDDADQAIHCLAELGLSVRDAGEVLGISHQRAQQILSR